MKFTITTAAFTLLAGAAFAGPQYVDETGFAVSGYDVVAYFDLEQAEVGEAQPEGIPGSTEFTAEHNGATFAFATAENRDTFLADPEKYAPQYDGHCAYGVAVDAKVPGNPDLWRIVDGKLYLNLNDDVVERWEDNIPGNIMLAEGYWDDLEGDSASNDPVPNFSTSDAPVTN
ncbi:YHS domain-containing (seleno)protein [Amaricoccus tamworthensis]|uniref:YHS domain-containing (seleno)protein n=1 Tax=Amaricoccus tamworthensis TaxID=57002 RepID=UPI003C7B5461